MSQIHFLGVSDFVWSIVSGVISLIFLFFFSVSFHCKIIKKVGSHTQLHTNGNMSISGLFILILTFLNVMSINDLITAESQTGILVQIILVMALACTSFAFFLYPVIFSKTSPIEEGLSAIYFTKSGVNCVRVIGNDYFIPWDECVDIGWASITTRGTIYYMYFSNRQLSEKEIVDIGTVNFSNQTLYVVHSKGLVDEVLQYVSEERIARFDYVNSKGKSTGLWK
jgi:hypothetical protein